MEDKKMRYPISWLLILCWICAASAQADFSEAFEEVWAVPEIQAKIDAGIEAHRKGDAVISVVDKDGVPLSEVTITAVQQTHNFLFGANLFVLGQLATPELNQRYENAFTDIFNFASLPFYWADLEPVRGQLRFEKEAPFIWRRPPPDVLLAWCKVHNITPKGHPLLWHSINPDWIPTEAEALRSAYTKRFEEIAQRYGQDILIWDVVNESLVCSKKYALYSEALDYVPWAFEKTRPLFPKSTLLMINEVTQVSHKPVAENQYLKQVETLLAAGTPIEGIGFQFHFFSRDNFHKYFPHDPTFQPDNLMTVYERFSQLELPLYITEITIPGSGDNGFTDQAQAVKQLYRLWFSIKRMAGITWWNLADKTAYGNEGQALGGLTDENLTPKPVWHALDQLINQDWTTQCTGKTDEKGRFSFRGFAGTYQINVVLNNERKQSFHISLPEATKALITCTID
jgi:endo-1,4-beta-xylanase